MYTNLRNKGREIEKGREKVGIELDVYYGSFKCSKLVGIVK